MYAQTPVIFLLLITLAGSGPLWGAAAGGTRTMIDTREKAVELLKLPDEAYFSLRDDAVLTLQNALSQLYRGDPLDDAVDAQPMIAIGAPLSASSADELPLLVATHLTGLRNWQVDPRQNFAVIATNLDTGQVRVARPHRRERKREQTPEPSASGAAPVGILAEQISNQVQKLDVARLWSDGLPPGRYALSVVMYDLISNRVFTDWRPAKNPPAAATWAPSVMATIRDGDKLREGVLFKLPERVAPAASIPLRATLSTPAARVSRLPVQNRDDVMFVPATLLLIRLDDPMAFSVDIAIPINAALKPTDRISVLFGADLRRQAPEAPAAGNYKGYLIVGRDLAGPESLVLE